MHAQLQLSAASPAGMSHSRSCTRTHDVVETPRSIIAIKTQLLGASCHADLSSFASSPSSPIMAYQLYIPSECFDPARTKHLPTPGKPLRIQIEGPKVTIDKLLPGVKWDVITVVPDFPQAAGPRLAALTYHALYRQYPRSGSTDLVVRDESLGWIVKPVWQGYVTLSRSSNNHKTQSKRLIFSPTARFIPTPSSLTTTSPRTIRIRTFSSLQCSTWKKTAGSMPTRARSGLSMRRTLPARRSWRFRGAASGARA